VKKAEMARLVARDSETEGVITGLEVRWGNLEWYTRVTVGVKCSREEKRGAID